MRGRLTKFLLRVISPAEDTSYMCRIWFPPLFSVRMNIIQTENHSCFSYTICLACWKIFFMVQVP